MILKNQKQLFDIPSDITFLNCAYMSPLLKKVKQAGIEGINKRAAPWDIKIDDWFGPSEKLRELFARIVNGNKENIALIPSVSYGIAIAANNISLTHEQTILLLDQEYPSNVYSWRELSKRTGATIVTIKREDKQSWTAAIISKITPKTGLVAIPNCHWTDGSIIDLDLVSEQTRKVNAKLVIDASQSLGAYPIAVNKIMPDFLVTVGYKWLHGPYNLGYLYADDKYCKNGNPIELSWLNKKGSEDFTKLVAYTDEFKSGARRFDAGEFPNFTHLPMAIAALTQIIDWGVENIQETLAKLTIEIETRAKDLGLETPQHTNRVGHLIGIKFTESKVALLGKKLAENQVYVSFRGTNMRIAPHLYNDESDIDKLFDLLK
jgi:selenocysteine lyase/cysteine desulfurase